MVVKEVNYPITVIHLIGCCSCQTTNGELSCAKDSKEVSNAVESKVPPIETGKAVVSPCFNATGSSPSPSVCCSHKETVGALALSTLPG